MNAQQSQACHLYCNEHKTQKEIAAIVGVTEKTIYNWIQQFSWYKMREEATNTIAQIASSLCQQLIAFQQSIMTRAELPGIPTLQDINLQGRLINMLDKLRRYQGKGQANNALTGFMHFVAGSDENLVGLLFDKYAEYTEKKNTGNRSPKTDETHSESTSSALSGSVPEPVKTGNTPEINSQMRNPVPIITEEEFRDKKHMLARFDGILPDSRVIFRNGYVNAMWLEYNMLQHFLPVDERNFIADAEDVIKHIDHKATQAKIRQYLNGQMDVAA